MKPLSRIVSLALVAALAMALPAAALAAGKSHDMQVEVVSIDQKAKTITIKDEKGENHTAPLLGKAVMEAKSCKAGEKVIITCKDNEKGDHEGVSAIRKG